MRRQISKVMWGIFCVAIGVMIMGNTFHWWNVTWYFRGWWTLLIIVPCFLGMIAKGLSSFATVGFTLGIMLLLNYQGIIGDDTLRRLVVPVILILIGVILVFKNIICDFRKVKATYGKEDCHAATFATIRCAPTAEKYHGGELDSIFGSLALDLRNTTVNENIIIHATSIFGGIVIYNDLSES